jgi:hypothetical protein
MLLDGWNLDLVIQPFNPNNKLSERELQDWIDEGVFILFQL